VASHHRQTFCTRAVGVVIRQAGYPGLGVGVCISVS